MSDYITIDACRSCGSDDLTSILSLGETPLADGLLTPEQLEEPEPRFPLTVAFCGACALVQLHEIVAPEIVFGEDYPYFSSFSDALLDHSRRNVEAIIASRGLNEDSLAVELASNDGYLLQYFAKEGIPVLGIDPAPGPAAAAEAAGVPTLCEFFSLEVAERLRAEGTTADVIVANNVLAHVADLNGFVAGIATLLTDDGVAVIEHPYLRDLIDHCEFDTIYHEHLCYFSVSALVPLFARHGLFLNDVEHLPIHGGSLRLFVGKRDEVSDTVRSYLADEDAAGMTRLEYYTDFADRVRGVRSGLVELLSSLREEGKTIAAYGAAAKGATLLNYSDVGLQYLDYVVDRNTHKQGRHMPGVHLPIHDPVRLLEDQPDYVLLLPWNFRDEILAQQQTYIERGGRFIVPIPEPQII
jgi:SAM-dependent methyltransferase